jgi:hypothetical protein
MKRIIKGAVVLATIPLLLVGIASAALAGGSAQGSGVSTMRPFDDGSWSPGGGIASMRPVDDGSWKPAADQPGVGTMRPFSDPNYAIHAQPVARAAQPSSPSSNLPLVALVTGLAALAVAAGALVTLARRKRLRPA